MATSGSVSGASGHVMAQLALLPVDEEGLAPMATHVAVQDGDWFDPATWGGEVPGQGAIVQIPEWVTVNYEGASDADIFLLRVDGTLNMTANDGVATVLSVDTMITSETSTLRILANRATDGTVGIVFTEADPADIPAHFADVSAGDGVLGRHSWDPQQLSLGLVASGTVDIRGQETLGHMQLETGPAAGATKLYFDADTPLSGTWSVGDKLVIGGASYEGRGGPGETLISQDEVRSIASIEVVNGQMVVTLDAPLAYDHRGPTTPQTGAELTGVVANLTRNVTFSSAVADMDGDGLMDRPVGVGDPKGPLDHSVTERGHVMFMHNDDVTVTDSAFYGLGRTDKSVPLDDFQLTEGDGGHMHRLYTDTNGNGVFDEGIDVALKTDPGEIENMRGRYALHIHEAGTGHAGHDEDEAEEANPCPETGDAVCRCNAEDTDGDGLPDCDVTHYGGAQIVGNVVWGSPGWGFVQHSSVADLIDNVAYDVAGSAFVAEAGDEVGSWAHNASFTTYGGRADFGTDDSDDFNEDGGFEGNGFYIKSRLLEVNDNVATSSARAGFFWHTNGVGLKDTDADWLDDLAAIAKSQSGVDTEDVPIRSFEGNQVIAAFEGLRLITDPTDSIRKGNDAWSHMKDFVAWEVDESGVSITYSSKYIFENFLLLGTDDKMSPQGQTASAGFFFKASVADITIVNSHVENFLNAYTDWVQVGDRQEYRRGFWDPKLPAGLIDSWNMEHYEGIGTDFGIENPAYNLWNINLVDVTSANITGTKIRIPAITITDDNGVSKTYAAYKTFNTKNASKTDDPGKSDSVKIELLDDSAKGGLVALWREDLRDPANARDALRNEIPLAYQEDVFLSQFYWENGELKKRASYRDYTQGINADIWSGTVLEFAKIDSLGRQVFAYDDYSPMDPGNAGRAVSTNERIVFSKEQIDAALLSRGYWTLDGASDLKFVELFMVFTDRLTGELTQKAFLVALDLAWKISDAADFLGIYHERADSVVAQTYAVFENGTLREDLPLVVRQFDHVMVDTPDGDVPVLSPQSDATRAGYAPAVGAPQQGNTVIAGTAGSDALIGTAAADTLDAGAGDDLLIGDGGDDVLFGGDGIDDLRGGNGADQLYGGAGHDVLIGGNGDDRLYGGDGDDRLNGGQGDDRLYGGDGDDELVGQAGTNILTGGAGADRFVYGSWSHQDRITDFEVGVDALDFLVKGLGFGDLDISQDGADARIVYRLGASEGVIVLEGVDMDDLTPDSFHFS